MRPLSEKPKCEITDYFCTSCTQLCTQQLIEISPRNRNMKKNNKMEKKQAFIVQNLRVCGNLHDLVVHRAVVQDVASFPELVVHSVVVRTAEQSAVDLLLGAIFVSKNVHFECNDKFPISQVSPSI